MNYKTGPTGIPRGTSSFKPINSSKQARLAPLRIPRRLAGVTPAPVAWVLLRQRGVGGMGMGVEG